MTDSHHDDQPTQGTMPPNSDPAHKAVAELAVLQAVDRLILALSSARRAVATLEEARQTLAPTLSGAEVRQAWLGCNLFLRDALQDLQESGMRVGDTLRAMLARD